jgi:hypothetical protein
MAVLIVFSCKRMKLTVIDVDHAIIISLQRGIYSYKIKILSRARKKPITKQLYRLTKKFNTVEDMKVSVMRELKEEKLNGDIGYFEAKQSTKRWVFEKEDIDEMYKKHSAGEIYLWYDKDTEDEPTMKRRKEESTGCSRRQEKENNIEKAYEELRLKHKDSFKSTQLKLWARMIINDLHESYDDPPNVPLITGMTKQKRRDATTTPARAVSPPTNTLAHVNIMSPGRCADVRMKNLQQLRYLQQLHQDNVLTESEFEEQKKKVLEALRTL